WHPPHGKTASTRKPLPSVHCTLPNGCRALGRRNEGDNMESATIQRHKTAIRRGDFSRPVKCLLRDGLIGKDVTFFDYGCGRGEDVELLTAEGIACGGWDQAYRPDAPRVEADVVNLGYVLNVIEDPQERADTLRRAWELCRQLLAVSAQVLVAGRGKEPVEFG